MTNDGATYAYFAQLLHLNHGRQATIPVDEVFGFLGLASRDIQEDIIPDYKKLLREDLIEATRVALTESHPEQMDLLCETGHLKRLPSLMGAGLDNTIAAHVLRFSAYKASSTAARVFEIDGDVLKVQALSPTFI